MTTFWIISALLLVVAVLFVGVPLWRGIVRNNAVVRDAANLEIYRDQIAEMDADLRNGLLTPELHEQGKRELQARLLEEVHPAQQQDVPARRNPYKTLTIVLTVLLPLASVGLYLQLGNQQAFSPMVAHGGDMAGQAAPSLKSLEEKVAQSPADPEALLMLARAYSDLGRFADAAKTYDSLTKIVPDEAWIWADYADALAMTHSTLMGPPTKLLERALKLDPNNLKTLALSGTAAMERGDYAAAVRHWEKLLKLVPADNPDAQMIKDGVQQARQLLAQSKGGKAALEQINESSARAQAGGKERISGTVTLDAELRNKADPSDTLFVLVRAAQGPKMPLAILRKQVGDLPLQFTLDDSMAMSPEMKMSNFDQVVVVARVSKSGNAMPQPGDLQGISKPLALGTSGIKLEIDQLVR